MNESAPSYPGAGPLESARAYLVRSLGGDSDGQRAAVERDLAAFAEAEALLSALRVSGGAEAWPQIIAVQAERARLAEALLARLTAWRVAGLAVAPVLRAVESAATPPETAAAPDAPAADARVDTPLSGDCPPPTAATAAEAGVPEPATAAVVTGDPVPAGDPPVDLSRAIAMLRANFAGNADGEESPDDAGSRARADAEALRGVVEPLTLPPEGWSPTPAEWEEELDALDRFTADPGSRWGGLPARYQRLLVAVSAALARHLQDLEPATDPAHAVRLNPLFSRLSAFSKEYYPGAVNGLARRHEPKGVSWLDDARAAFAELRLEAGLPALGGVRDATAAAPVRVATLSGADIEIDTFLTGEGFETDADRARAREVLTEAQLSNPRKRRIAASKLERARALFRDARLRLCRDPDCARLRADLYQRTDPPVLLEDAARCDICAGSDNRRALLALVRCLRSAGVRRFLVVGGGDDARADLRRTLEEWDVEVREVNAAKGSHTRKEAEALMGWAEVGVLWGSTQLPHKVSNLFRDPPSGLRMVNPNARGVTSLCESVIESLCGG